MVDIGNKIKELRTEQKMTQSDLAERFRSNEIIYIFL